MTKTYYLWDFANDSYLVETDGSGAATAVYTTEPVQFGKLISLRQESSTHYYHFDAQQSTRQLSDDNQNVTDEYAFSAFGELIAISGTTPNPMTYHGAHGCHTDAHFGIAYLRSRYYGQSTGRFLSRDPLMVAESFTEPYRYVRNNPVNFTDPSGLECGACPTPWTATPRVIIPYVSYWHWQYGCYCGKGAAPAAPGPPPVPPTPIDDVDKACQGHDACCGVAKTPAAKIACNNTLCTDATIALDRLCAQAVDPRCCCKAARSIIAVFCDPAIGDSNC